VSPEVRLVTETLLYVAPLGAFTFMRFSVTLTAGAYTAPKFTLILAVEVPNPDPDIAISSSTAAEVLLILLIIGRCAYAWKAYMKKNNTEKNIFTFIYL